MAIYEVVSGGDRQSLFKRFMHKSKMQAISELVDIHLLHCRRIEKLEAERDAALVEVERLRESKGDPVGSLEKCMKVMYERDEHAKRLEAALARVAELEGKLTDWVHEGFRLNEALAMASDAASKGDAARHAACGMEMEIQELKAKLAELEKQEPLLHINPLVVDELLGRAKRSPGGLTWSKGRCGSWTLPLYAAPVAQAQQSVPDGAADLCRFLAKLYCELDGLRYSTAKLPAEQIADALIFKWPVLQGARNQLNIKRISEQPYDESKLHSAIAAMIAAAHGKEVGHE
ncbi:TPA: hypothetical protein ACGW8S_000318 [Pseudomonas aeruginosa]